MRIKMISNSNTMKTYMVETNKYDFHKYSGPTVLGPKGGQNSHFQSLSMKNT